MPTNNHSAKALEIQLTPKAVKKLQEYKALLLPGIDSGLRIGIKKEGAHLKKILGFDKKRFTDEVYSHEDLTVFIDRREIKHFLGYSIDFKNTATQKGFVFKAPKPTNNN